MPAGVQQAQSKAALNAHFVQKPQDGRADAALNLSLGSSYVTYNLQTINQIADFFKTQQVHLAYNLSSVIGIISSIEKVNTAAFPSV